MICPEAWVGESLQVAATWCTSRWGQHTVGSCQQRRFFLGECLTLLLQGAGTCASRCHHIKSDSYIWTAAGNRPSPNRSLPWRAPFTPALCRCGSSGASLPRTGGTAVLHPTASHWAATWVARGVSHRTLPQQLQLGRGRGRGRGRRATGAEALKVLMRMGWKWRECASCSSYIQGCDLRHCYCSCAQVAQAHTHVCVL